MEQYQEHFWNRFDQLTAHDKIRFHKIMESTQYCLLYVLVAILFGTIVNNMFPEFDPEADNEAGTIGYEVFLQVALIAIAIFYIRKVVKLVPYALTFDNDYIPQKSDFTIPEYSGEIIIGVVLVATQTKLMDKLKFLSQSFKDKYSDMFNINQEENDETTEGMTDNEKTKVDLNNTPNNRITNHARRLPVNMSSKQDLSRSNGVMMTGGNGGMNGSGMANNSNINTAAGGYNNGGSVYGGNQNNGLDYRYSGTGIDQSGMNNYNNMSSMQPAQNMGGGYNETFTGFGGNGGGGGGFDSSMSGSSMGAMSLDSFGNNSMFAPNTMDGFTVSSGGMNTGGMGGSSDYSQLVQQAIY
jgi:hypothetical protein